MKLFNYLAIQLFNISDSVISSVPVFTYKTMYMLIYIVGLLMLFSVDSNIHKRIY